MTEKIDRTGRVNIPLMMHPLFKTEVAIQSNVHRKLLFKTWGGIGDQICAEPTLRYALNHFKDCEISLASERPELFQHLKFKRVFNLKEESPIYENYLVFETITPPDDSNMVWLFFSHMLTHCVDFPSLCALRSQLPIAEKEIVLKPTDPEVTYLENNQVWVHPGKHWPSKTFPKDWWDEVLDQIIMKGFKPILVGADTDDNRGTVNVDASQCLDLRNKLSVNDSIWHLQRCRSLVTNDSAPLHMAASGNAEIHFIATCKHPDYLYHWRRGVFAWSMKNHGKGGVWDLVDHCPNKNKKVTVDQIDENVLRSWLPDPKELVSEVCPG